ncbi:hypothetical protein Tco_0781793 [Tanacetum coccineum]
MLKLKILKDLKLIKYAALFIKCVALSKDSKRRAFLKLVMKDMFDQITNYSEDTIRPISIKVERRIRHAITKVTTKGKMKINTTYPEDSIRLVEQIWKCQYNILRRYQTMVLLLHKEIPIRHINLPMDSPIRVDDDLHNLSSVEAEFPSIVINNAVSPQDELQCKSKVSTPVNDEIEFRISFDESDDEDYIILFDKNSFSYKMIYVNDLKTDSENDSEKAMPSIPSPEHVISCFDDLDFFKDFKNEFLAIVYNDAQTSKSDLLTESILNPQHIDEFNLKDETSLSECDEEEQNVLNFNDLFPFNVIYPNDSKSDKDNDDDKVDIEHSSGDLSVKPLPDVINTDVGAYAHGSNKLLETRPREGNIDEYWWRIYESGNLEVLES